MLKDPLLLCYELNHCIQYVALIKKCTLSWISLLNSVVTSFRDKSDDHFASSWFYYYYILCSYSTHHHQSAAENSNLPRSKTRNQLFPCFPGKSKTFVEVIHSWKSAVSQGICTPLAILHNLGSPLHEVEWQPLGAGFIPFHAAVAMTLGYMGGLIEQMPLSFKQTEWNSCFCNDP